MNKEDMLLKFTSLGKDAIFKNHYDLAERFPDYSSEDWRDFLLEPDIQAFIYSEQRIMLQVEQRKIAKDASDSKSVGQAQMITALDKMNQQIQEQKTGPICIYNFIDLTPEQKEFSIIDYHRYKLVEIGQDENIGNVDNTIVEKQTELQNITNDFNEQQQKLTEINLHITEKMQELEQINTKLKYTGDDLFDEDRSGNESS